MTPNLNNRQFCGYRNEASIIPQRLQIYQHLFCIICRESRVDKSINIDSRYFYQSPAKIDFGFDVPNILIRSH